MPRVRGTYLKDNGTTFTKVTMVLEGGTCPPQAISGGTIGALVAGSCVTLEDTTTGCFIATAVYGETSDEVARLRKYRDEKLKKTIHGRAFISIYYAISPKILPLFNRSDKLRNSARRILNKIIKSLGDEYDTKT